MANYDDVKTPAILYIGGFSVAVTLVLIMLLQVVFFASADPLQRSEAVSAAPAHSGVTAEALQQLKSYRPVDKENGIYGIPIDQAKKQVLQRLKATQGREEIPPFPPAPTGDDGEQSADE